MERFVLPVWDRAVSVIRRKSEASSEALEAPSIMRTHLGGEVHAFLIDMAIGLRDSDDQIRPDDAARKLLGKRASTIFSIPCRKAVYADDEASQKEANIKAFGKSLAKQTLMIIPKIRELDEFLNAHPEYKNRILGSHPELDFGRLNGKILMSHKKKPEGVAEREQILKHWLPGIPMPAGNQKHRI